MIKKLPTALETALSLVKDTPEEESEVVTLFESGAQILAAEILLKRVGGASIIVDDYSVEDLMAFAKQASEKIYSRLDKDGKPKLPHLVDLSRATTRVLKRFEEVNQLLREKSEEFYNSQEGKALLEEQKSILASFWLGSGEFTHWQQVLVATHINHYKANLGKS